MKRAREQVLEFYETMPGLKDKVPEEPMVLDKETFDFRVSFIREELDELIEAWNNNDIVAIADALADLKYVIEGTAVESGLNLEPLFNEVHRSNMTKVNGYPREGDGKWMKPTDYSPPNLKPIVDSMYAKEVEEECKHEVVVPKIDVSDEELMSMTTQEIREKYPRFSGNCPTCDSQVILYGSAVHYIAGDW